MKKLLTALLCALLLCGCTPRGRISSAELLPENFTPGVTPETSAPAVTEKPASVRPETLTPGCVVPLRTEQGDYTDNTGKTVSYRYQLPYVDFASGDAIACNREIDAEYGAVIGEQSSLREKLLPLTVRSLTYTCADTGGLVTLRVFAEYSDGFMKHSEYCFLPDGSFAESRRILSLLGVREQDFIASVQEQLTAYYDISNRSDADAPGYQTNFEKSLAVAEDLSNLRLFPEDGVLTVCLTVFRATGLPENAELRIPYSPAG